MKVAVALEGGGREREASGSAAPLRILHGWEAAFAAAVVIVAFQGKSGFEYGKRTNCYGKD